MNTNDAIKAFKETLDMIYDSGFDPVVDWVKVFANKLKEITK